jgi:hypothetical protein
MIYPSKVANTRIFSHRGALSLERLLTIRLFVVALKNTISVRKPPGRLITSPKGMARSLTVPAAHVEGVVLWE